MDATGRTAKPAPAAVAAGDPPLRPLRWQPLPGRAGQALALLFPEGPARSRSRGQADAGSIAYLAAIALGAWVLLERQAGVRPWNTIWAEDGGVFYPQALLHPVTSLVQPYAGYLQLVPRLIADAVAALPFQDAAAGFAVSGAVVASACAMFVFRASEGHVRALPLRVLLPVSVILLPVALTEISGNGVNTPWYLLFALFWALLWRPRFRGGMAVAFLVCFAAASSNALAGVFAPLVGARVVALPRVKDQAASAGWAAGGALQLVSVVRSAGLPHSGSVGMGLSFYVHGVLVPAVAGRHIAGMLTAQTSAAVVATAAVCIAAGVSGWAFITGGPRVRLFVTAALCLGLVLVVVSALVRGWGTPGQEEVSRVGGRYAVTPILLIDSLAIVAADAYLRRAGHRARRVAPALGLAAILAAAWASDFSYLSARSSNPPWPQLVAGFQQRCDQQQPPMGWARMPEMDWIRPPPVLPCSLVNDSPA